MLLSYYTGVFHLPATFALCPSSARVPRRSGVARLLLAATVTCLSVAPTAGLAQAPPARAERPASPAAPAEDRDNRRASDEDDALVTFPGGIMWQVTLPAQPAHGPAFDDARVYVPLRNQSLHAVALDTGLLAWSVPQPATLTPAVTGQWVIGASGTTIWARDARTGSPAWSRALEAAPASVVTIARDVALFVRAGTLTAVRASDGQTIWERTVDADISTRPAADADRVFAGTADGRVLALAVVSGDPRWTRTVGGRIVTLSTGDDRVVVGSDTNQVVVLNARSGARDWKWRLGGDPLGSTSFNRKQIFYVALDNALRAHHRGNGHLAWARNLEGRPISGPVWLGDRVLVAGLANELRAYDWRDGSPAGVVGVPARVIHQPYLATEAGDVPARLVVVLASGDIQAIGTTPEPPIMPLTTLPGVPLVPDAVKRPGVTPAPEKTGGG